MGKNDREIRSEVIEALKNEPKLSREHSLEVGVDQSVVTLSGTVRSYRDKLIAGTIAELIPGVSAVIQHIEVILPPESTARDLDIAQSVRCALGLNSAVPSQHIELSVEDGKVILNGAVDWTYQRDEVESTVSKIPGVRGITNNIAVNNKLGPSNIISEIEKAFQHIVAQHAQEIHVEIKGAKAILKGVARAWFEKQIAEEVVREKLGIQEVDNQITLTPLSDRFEEQTR
jgi:osmotically-inducible protein OsmY